MEYKTKTCHNVCDDIEEHVFLLDPYTTNKMLRKLKQNCLIMIFKGVYNLFPILVYLMIDETCITYKRNALVEFLLSEIKTAMTISVLLSPRFSPNLRQAIHYTDDCDPDKLLSKHILFSLLWRHNGRDGVSNHQPVYSTVYSNAHQRYIKAPRHWPLWGDSHTNGH